MNQSKSSTNYPWLGVYPNHWQVRPLWTMFRRVKRVGFEGEELLSVYRDFGVVPKASRDDNFNKASEDLSAYQLVESGDLVINKMKAWQGSVAISNYRGIVSPAYFVYTPFHDANPKFLHYLFRSPPYIAGYLSLSKGIRVNQWDLEPQVHSRIPVLLPPIPEQRFIASFLDQETSKIDALISEQQRLIELLKEKRQAVISHAVTKGLNPEVRMKPSGVEWLGEVPEHWEVRKVSQLFKAAKGTKGQMLTKEFLGENEGEYPVYSGQTENDGVMGRWDQYEFDFGDVGVLFSTTVGAKAMHLRHLFGKFSLSQNCMIIWPTAPKCQIRFFYYHFQPLFRYQRAMIPEHMQASFRVEDLKGYLVAVPPQDEQMAISKFVDGEIRQFDALVSEAELAISLLQERRTALISAAVTGKIDVRNYAATQKDAA